MNYQEQTLAVMNGMELVVTLYDGMVRFLYRAIASVEAGDVVGRRDAMRGVLEILTYLQARLRTDIGGEPAAALAEFYAAMYAQCVRASRDESVALCRQTIAEIRNVRDAWQKVAESECPATAQARDRQMQQHLLVSRNASPTIVPPPVAVAEPAVNRWSA